MLEPNAHTRQTLDFDPEPTTIDEEYEIADEELIEVFVDELEMED